MDEKQKLEAKRLAQKKWAGKQAQIAFRLSPEIKAQIDAHAAETGEGLVKFITRACLEQIERDKQNPAG